MTEEGFWGLNADLPWIDADVEIARRLSELSPDEVVSYQTHFDRCHEAAYQWRLWGAAYLIDGGCSDDGFIDFRYGLISRGREVYQAALVDPDSLAAIVKGEDSENGVGYIPNEDFGYAAGTAYERVSGNEIPRTPYEGTDAPLGEDWDFDNADENAKRFPKLWAKFGW